MQKPKRKRRTKAEMEAARAAEAEVKPKRKRRTKAEMEAARAAESKVKAKPKRKRRTKAEMEAARAAEKEPEPMWYEKGYEGPKPEPKKHKKPRSYPKPPPKPKFDVDAIDETITMPGGAKYGRTIETKHGRHIISWNDHGKDWGILYDARYNDTDHHWEFYQKLKKRLEEPINKKAPKKKRKPNGKQNRNIRKRKLQVV